MLHQIEAYMQSTLVFKSKAKSILILKPFQTDSNTSNSTCKHPLSYTGVVFALFFKRFFKKISKTLYIYT